ncbi:uncharacterized protein LOC131663056 [Phymastichus coffea]|uniref:uncharacterized protein LOC131663056 n=1 Tax=Phymastichus coffea TaxID=108790 RepID=UPI00273BF73B|nr:uncharacterized protein LOC131663056 [Phymastichus coffea]
MTLTNGVEGGGISGQFVSCSITDDNLKYCHTLSSLTEKAIDQVEDILKSSPGENRYTNVKTKMIDRLTESDSWRVRRLMESEQMGDRKPSEFFRSRKSLATSNTTEDFIIQVWKTRLPLQLQTVLAASSETDVAKILKLADAVHEVKHTTSKQVNAVDDYSALSEQIK